MHGVKMNFMQRSQIILLIIILIFSLLIFFFRDFFIISHTVSFFQSFASDFRASLFQSKVEDESRLSEENRILNEKLSQLEIIERENIALKSQFQDANYPKFELLPVKIIGYKGRGVYDFFMVNAGKIQGVQDGMAVIMGNTLVGTIHKADQNISEVRTVLHPEFSTLVKYPPTNARGIIRGFNSYMILENVLVTDTLEKGGTLITMGETNKNNIGIPSELIVGKIDSIERIDTASFQTAQVEPFIDYSQISNVFVILGYRK